MEIFKFLKYKIVPARRRSPLGFLAACIVIFSLSGTANAEDRVYKIEAAFLYNFFNYITWPEQGSPDNLKDATICIYGNNSLYNSLDYIKQKKLEERDLQIKKLDAKKPAANCHIVFISSGYASQSPPLANLLSEPDTLVISDIPGFLDKGGMIELGEDGGRIVISINNSLLAKSGFAVSSRLLNIARRVE